MSVPAAKRAFRSTVSRLGVLEGRWPVAIFAAGHLLIVAILFRTIYTIPFSSLGLYFKDASKIVGGAVPYRDFVLEYPPGALLVFLPPRLLSADYGVYAFAFRALLFAADFAAMFLLQKIARRADRSPWELLAIYTIGLLALGPIVFEQYDLFPAVLTLAAVYCFATGRDTASWICLAVGVMMKLYPIFVAPLFAARYLRAGEPRRILRAALVSAGTGVVLILPFVIASPRSLLTFVRYHGDRGLQLESSYSAVLLVLDRLNVMLVSTQFSFGSWNIAGWNGVVRASTYVLIAAVALTYWRLYGTTSPSRPDAQRLGAEAFLVITVVLVASKILSPQYLIWLLPLLPLATSRGNRSLLALFVITGMLTYYIFPWHYDALISGRGGAVAALFIRNLLLASMVFAVVASWRGATAQSDSHILS